MLVTCVLFVVSGYLYKISAINVVFNSSIIFDVGNRCILSLLSIDFIVTWVIPEGHK